MFSGVSSSAFLPFLNTQTVPSFKIYSFLFPPLPEPGSVEEPPPVAPLSISIELSLPSLSNWIFGIKPIEISLKYPL